jgi:SAM-dependent methyltransferase
MAPGDHPESLAGGVGSDVAGGADADSHWVRWHTSYYEDPSSGLSLRLRLVQKMLRSALDDVAEGLTHPGEIRVVSLCAGQGRDVIDVVATHPRGPDVSALLVDLDPSLVAFARDRAVAAGVADRVRVVEGDASVARTYGDASGTARDCVVPADIVLVCGVFGNISGADITRTIQAMRGFCVPGGQVIWTRHRRPPDMTPSIREDFAAAGFTELDFEAPEEAILTVGRHRLDGPTVEFDPDQRLFTFVGDGWNPV